MDNEFQWNDALAAEFAEYYRKKQGVDYTTWGKCILDSFKASKIPVKEVLFYTADNKPVYEGDRLYPVFISEGFGYIPYTFIPQKWTVDVDANYFNSVKYFSTEEAAKEFVTLNKPCLSVQNVIDNLKKCCDGTYNPPERWNFEDDPIRFITLIKELAKSKL